MELWPCYPFFFGGPLADKFPARNLISIALWGTGLGGMVLVLYPVKALLPYMYAYWGLTTIFLFWAALIRSVRIWGGEDIQGKAFGYLEGGRGAIAAIIATFSVVVFAWLIPDPESVTATQRNYFFSVVLLSASLYTIVVGILIWFFIPKKTNHNNFATTWSGFQNLRRILRTPSIWLQGLIVISAYVGYKMSDIIPLYAHDVFDFTEVESARLGSMALWVRPFLAVLAGYLADRVRGSKIVAFFFLLNLVFSTLLTTGSVEN